MSTCSSAHLHALAPPPLAPFRVRPLASRMRSAAAPPRRRVSAAPRAPRSFPASPAPGHDVNLLSCLGFLWCGGLSAGGWPVTLLIFTRKDFTNFEFVSVFLLSYYSSLLKNFFFFWAVCLEKSWTRSSSAVMKVRLLWRFFLQIRLLMHTRQHV